MRNSLNKNKSGKKIAVVHDYLYTYGGAERVFEAMCEAFPKADIFTSYYVSGELPEKYKKLKINESFLGKLPFLKYTFLKRYFTFPNYFAFKTINFKDYDLIISSCTGPSKGLNFSKNARHFSYIHTPPWVAWGIKAPTGFLMRMLKPLLRKIDFSASQKPTLLIANSKNTQARIKSFYNRESIVITPPVEVREIKEYLKNKRVEKKDYFLMCSRLDYYKGVSVVAKILDKNGIKMKIIGKGEDEKNLQGLSKNIEYLGFVSDEKKYEVMAGAKALIMWNSDDFGITMAESLASGTPIIAFGEGGALEIVKDGENGVLFKDQNEKELLSAIDRLAKISFSKDEIQKSAEKFSREEFVKKLKKVAEV